MKKMLAFTAILSAASFPALAQSSMTIYGINDIGISHEKNGAAAGSSTRMDSGIQSGSRLGFKGVEPLGGGLAAIFTLENGFNGDSGSLGQGGLLFGRQAWVGLSGNFGTVKLGRQNTPLFATLFTIDPFETGLAGDQSRIFSAGGFRMNNTINYATPSFNGLSAQFAYGIRELSANSTSARQTGFSGQYASGPLLAVVTYHNASNPAVMGGSTSTTLLATTYNFGLAKLHAAFAVNKGNTQAGDTVQDTRDAMLGVSVLAGSGTVIASYIRKNDRRIADGNATQLAIGYVHPLSKRTNLYTSYARTTNETAARYNIDQTAPSGTSGNLFNVGIRHKF
ncbi:porin [Noviherbaspirillum soli]|uniref:porin n=1 Tax=Noviherbaspirillum soli TaxID=1064518 RepID=UPI00188CF53D|nr:porin [Noviherbaspirillum soli]